MGVNPLNYHSLCIPNTTPDIGWLTGYSNHSEVLASCAFGIHYFWPKWYYIDQRLIMFGNFNQTKINRVICLCLEGCFAEHALAMLPCPHIISTFGLFSSSSLCSCYSKKVRVAIFQPYFQNKCLFLCAVSSDKIWQQEWVNACTSFPVVFLHHTYRRSLMCLNVIKGLIHPKILSLTHPRVVPHP